MLSAIASACCVFGMILWVTRELWTKKGRESHQRLRFALHFLPTRQENAVLRRTPAKRVFQWDTTQTMSADTRAYGRTLMYSALAPCVARLCVSQAAAADPHVRYHYRGNAEFIRHSICLCHCLTGDETGVSALGTMERSTPPGQGCPQRSQLQPACISVSRTGNSSNATSFNISLVVSASSVNSRLVFIESLLVQLNAIAAAAARLCVCWVLLCKNCVAVCAAYPRRIAVSSKRFL